MASIGVSEAAKRLGVSPRRVRARIEDGSLPAEPVGSQWNINEADLIPLLERKEAGRPLSERSAWAVVFQSHPDYRPLAQALPPMDRSRARKRWNHLVHLVQDRPDSVELAALLRDWFRNRADRQVFHASPRDLPDLREDPRVHLSGLSHSGSEIASGGVVEGYVSYSDLGGLIEEYLLSPASEHSEGARNGNVVLHVAVDPPHEVSPLLVAADLAEHRGPREEARAVGLLGEIVATGDDQ